jgi:hypothetical protein
MHVSTTMTAVPTNSWSQAFASASPATWSPLASSVDNKAGKAHASKDTPNFACALAVAP